MVRTRGWSGSEQAAPDRRQEPTDRKRPNRRVIALQSVPAGRLLAVYLLLAASLIGLSVRLAWLHVKEGDRLQSRARAIQTQQVKPIGRRRPIVDRQGRLVALDEERFTLLAHPRFFNFPGDDPQLVRTPTDVAQRLASVLVMPETALVQSMGPLRSGVKLAT